MREIRKKKKEGHSSSLSPHDSHLFNRTHLVSHLVHPAACTIMRILRTSTPANSAGRECDLIVILRRRANEYPFVHPANPDKWVQINADERRRGVKAK